MFSVQTVRIVQSQYVFFFQAVVTSFVLPTSLYFFEIVMDNMIKTCRMVIENTTFKELNLKLLKYSKCTL